MEADERRRIEEAMAKISQMKRDVEADPAAAVKASLDASTAEFQRRVRRILLWVLVVIALALAISLVGRLFKPRAGFYPAPAGIGMLVEAG